MNLYNIHYTSSGQDYDYQDNDINIKQYQFDKPDKIFLLPSSDESGDERKDTKIPTFTKICDDIIDFEALTLINEDKPEERELPKHVHPIIMFRGQDPLLSLEKVLGFIKSHVQNVPYEIKIMPIFKSNENKYTLSFSCIIESKVLYTEYNSSKRKFCVNSKLSLLNNFNDSTCSVHC